MIRFLIELYRQPMMNVSLCWIVSALKVWIFEKLMMHKSCSLFGGGWGMLKSTVNPYDIRLKKWGFSMMKNFGFVIFSTVPITWWPRKHLRGHLTPNLVYFKGHSPICFSAPGPISRQSEATRFTVHLPVSFELV